MGKANLLTHTFLNNEPSTSLRRTTHPTSRSSRKFDYTLADKFAKLA